MLLLFHVCSSLISIVFTTFVAFSPSQSKLFFSHILTATTLLSGAALLYMNPESLNHVCIMGVLYIVYVAMSLKKAYNRLYITVIQ